MKTLVGEPKNHTKLYKATYRHFFVLILVVTTFNIVYLSKGFEHYFPYHYHSQGHFKHYSLRSVSGT